MHGSRDSRLISFFLVWRIERDLSFFFPFQYVREEFVLLISFLRERKFCHAHLPCSEGLPPSSPSTQRIRRYQPFPFFPPTPRSQSFSSPFPFFPSESCFPPVAVPRLTNPFLAAAVFLAGPWRRLGGVFSFFSLPAQVAPLCVFPFFSYMAYFFFFFQRPPWVNAWLSGPSSPPFSFVLRAVGMSHSFEWRRSELVRAAFLSSSFPPLLFVFSCVAFFFPFLLVSDKSCACPRAPLFFFFLFVGPKNMEAISFLFSLFFFCRR